MEDKAQEYRTIDCAKNMVRLRCGQGVPGKVCRQCALQGQGRVCMVEKGGVLLVAGRSSQWHNGRHSTTWYWYTTLVISYRQYVINNKSFTSTSQQSTLHTRLLVTKGGKTSLKQAGNVPVVTVSSSLKRISATSTVKLLYAFLRVYGWHSKLLFLFHLRE